MLDSSLLSQHPLLLHLLSSESRESLQSVSSRLFLVGNITANLHLMIQSSRWRRLGCSSQSGAGETPPGEFLCLSKLDVWMGTSSISKRIQLGEAKEFYVPEFYSPECFQCHPESHQKLQTNSKVVAQWNMEQGKVFMLEQSGYIMCIFFFFSFLWSCAIIRVYSSKRPRWWLWAGCHTGRRHPA